MKHEARPKAYSYIRFSTPEQAKGDSFRRQEEQARVYADVKGLDLDTELTFRDLGVSAFTGKNASAGALGAFLKAVNDGEISRGSYLLVESLDRVSRQTVRKAARTMEEIVDAGINLVDLSDGEKVYNAETLDNDPTAFLIMTVRFMRAHEESARKAQRLTSAYERKRKDAAEGKNERPFTRRLPAWLMWDEDQNRTVVIRERGAVVREIFKKAEHGWGTHKIAVWLNQRELPTWGDKKRAGKYWHRSYIRKLLTNSATIGTFTPHKVHRDGARKRREPLEPIEDYWPAVVSREIFERVAGRFNTTAARGRHTDTKPVSIFAGLAKCARCDGTVTRVSKGDHVYLVCSKANARAKGCAYQAVRYGDVEKAITRNARMLLKDAPRGKNTQEITRAIAAADHELSELLDKANDAANELLQGKSDTLRRRLREIESEIQEARGRLRELRERRDTISAPVVAKRLTALRTLLTTKPLDVAATNIALKDVVETITVDPEAEELRLKWRHADEQEHIPFYSRHIKAFDKIR